VTDAKVGVDVKGALGIAVLLVVFAAFVGEPILGMLIAPVVFLLAFYMMWRVPLRYSMMGLMFLALTLENPAERPAADYWKSPFFQVGAIMLTHLNRSIDIKALMFSGMDVMLGALLVIAFLRKQSGSKIDKVGRIETPEHLVRLAYVSLGGALFVLLTGMVRGGDFSMALWQLDRVIYLPIVFLLFSLALRGPKDHHAFARVFIFAAVVRAIWAIALWATIDVPPDANGVPGRLPWATSHHDSILFGCAFVLLAALLLERADRSYKRLAMALLPILVLGMIANNRRMVWVDVGLVFTTLYFATPTNATKRKVKMVALMLAPIAAIYVGAGWESKSAVFKPVQTIRSVVDPQSDGSTLWREMENFNLLFTIRNNTVLGTGYGREYWEVMPLPAIDYTLERYLPHNAILGLWCYCGFIGYTALTLLWGAGVYFAMRAYRAAKIPTDRAAALTCLGSVLIYMIQCWGDMGLGSWTGVFTVGPALAIAGKTAVAVDAWPSSKRRASKPVPVAVRRTTVEGQVA
jgi:hypothetical protein